MNRYVVVDIESTGIKLSEDEIIEIGAVYIEDNVVKNKMSTLVKPKNAISNNITNITAKWKEIHS